MASAQHSSGFEDDSGSPLFSTFPPQTVRRGRGSDELGAIRERETASGSRGFHVAAFLVTPRTNCAILQLDKLDVGSPHSTPDSSGSPTSFRVTADGQSFQLIWPANGARHHTPSRSTSASLTHPWLIQATSIISAKRLLASFHQRAAVPGLFIPRPESPALSTLVVLIVTRDNSVKLED